MLKWVETVEYLSVLGVCFPCFLYSALSVCENRNMKFLTAKGDVAVGKQVKGAMMLLTHRALNTAEDRNVRVLPASGEVAESKRVESLPVLLTVSQIYRRRGITTTCHR